MEHYKINSHTLALVPINKNKTKVYENKNVIIVRNNIQHIIEENCEYYGSSYAGRKKGTVEMIGVTHKSPIVIEDSKMMIFFPTCSPRLTECSWISLNNIDTYGAYENDSIIRFRNNLSLQIPVSNKIINNQVLRATRLESVMHRRKKDLFLKKHKKQF